MRTVRRSLLAALVVSFPGGAAAACTTFSTDPPAASEAGTPDADVSERPDGAAPPSDASVPLEAAAPDLSPPCSAWSGEPMIPTTATSKTCTLCKPNDVAQVSSWLAIPGPPAAGTYVLSVTIQGDRGMPPPTGITSSLSIRFFDSDGGGIGAPSFSSPAPVESTPRQYTVTAELTDLDKARTGQFAIQLAGSQIPFCIELDHVTRTLPPQ